MSVIIHGIGLGGGIAIGHAYFVEQNLEKVTQTTLYDESEVLAEVRKFEEALAETRRELELLRNNTPPNAPAELGAFLSLNIMMLNDSKISQAVQNIIREEKCNAKWAIKVQTDILAGQFDEMVDEYLKERKYDIIQLFERIFKNLEGNRFNWDKDGKFEHGILVTHDLSPADLVNVKDSNFSGFITERGSLTSHTAIIGRNLSIPAIVSANFARQLVSDSELIIVDGIQGVLIIDPPLSVLNEYKLKQKSYLQKKAKLFKIRKEDAVTLDDINIELLANIENIVDIDEVIYNKASGIGLFRSEFLFLNKDGHLATEDEQYDIYVKVAKKMKGLPVVIRTADLGADKKTFWAEDDNLNPSLGLIGIRLSLADQGFFRIQLRAILRASVYGNIQIMFPMISSDLELKQAINQVNYVKEELVKERISFNPDIKIGVMIEVPAAAFAIKGILSQVDFISIGTNDLIQYLLAIDRNNEDVNYLYNPLHPAVLKLISHVIKSANKASIPVTICGEMAGDMRLTRLLLGMGLCKFSMYPANLLNIKNIVLNTNITSITSSVSQILRTENLKKIEELVRNLNMD